MLTHRVSEFRKCNRQETLTFELSVHPQEPIYFSLQFVLALHILSCEGVFFNDILLVHELVGLKICMRTLFVNSSGQRNVMHQLDFSFLFFTFVMYRTQLEVSNYVFSFIEMSLAHFLALMCNVLTILVDFLPEISISFMAKPQIWKGDPRTPTLPCVMLLSAMDLQLGVLGFCRPHTQKQM